jgi:hypothetical protein
MFVFMDESAEAVMAVDAQVRDRGWIGDRLGEWARWPGVPNAPMRTMRVVVLLVFAEGVDEMCLVPDQRAVE